MMVLPNTPLPYHVLPHLQQRLNTATVESSQPLNHPRLEFIEKELRVHRQLHSTYLSVIQENVELHREIREANARNRCRPAWPTERCASYFWCAAAVLHALYTQAPFLW